MRKGEEPRGGGGWFWAEKREKNRRSSGKGVRGARKGWFADPEAVLLYHHDSRLLVSDRRPLPVN